MFGPLVEKYLLANKHRVTVELLPDRDLAAKEEEQEKAELAAFKQKLVDSELQDVIKSTQELKERQVGSWTTCCAQNPSVVMSSSILNGSLPSYLLSCSKCRRQRTFL